MTSEPQEAYVWVWLPDQLDPVVAGRLYESSGHLMFHYGRHYLERDNAIALHWPELPLRRGAIAPLPGLSIHGCLRDGAPDAWGRRVILNRLYGGGERDTDYVNELTFLLNSGSDRPGALDFQQSASHYVARKPNRANLAELQEASALVDAGKSLPAALERALLHGTSLGGARPKAQIDDNEGKYIAKFSSSTDVYSVVKAEFVAMRLAAKLGLQVANVKLAQVAGKDVLLVERFDRQKTEAGWLRRQMVSALTLFELDEMMARYASYQTLAEIIRHRFSQPKQMAKELFSRMVFNLLCGNTDDHARNHAAFWDGAELRLTPAYDICPQPRAGNEASQAMLIHDNHRLSRLTTCIQSAPSFLLEKTEAATIIQQQVDAIHELLPAVMDEAEVNEIDRHFLTQRVFLNPYVFE